MTQYRWEMAVQMAVYRTTERDITVSNPRQTIKLGFLKCRSQDPLVILEGGRLAFP